MAIDKLKEIIKDFDQSSATSLDYEDETFRVSLKKDGFKADDGKTENFDNCILSPVVGVFYHIKPELKIGERVKPGDTICVINAMKVMNKITADKEGIIEEFFFKDGDIVEYNAPLVRINYL